MRVLLIAVLLLIFSHPIYAQETSASYAETAVALTASGNTRIEVDEQANVIRFFIDGQERAFLDTEGFYVRPNIKFGGQIVDFGEPGFDARAAESRGGPDAE